MTIKRYNVSYDTMREHPTGAWVKHSCVSELESRLAACLDNRAGLIEMLGRMSLERDQLMTHFLTLESGADDRSYALTSIRQIMSHNNMIRNEVKPA